MATTAQEALDLAVARGSLNESDLVPSTQALRWIVQAERFAFIEAAKFNPEFFGTEATTAVRAAYTDGWNLSTAPGGIAALTRFEALTIAGSVTGISVGTQINQVDFRWPNHAASPRAFVRNRILYGYGTELGASNPNMVTSLTVYFAQLPGAVPTLGSSLSIPDEWIDLVVLPVAKILAIRDRRLDEVESIKDEYGILRASFLQHIQSYDAAATRPVDAVPIATALDSLVRM